MIWHFVPQCSPCEIFIALRDAWNVLGDMPKDEAMENYVNEIKKVGRILILQMHHFPSVTVAHVLISSYPKYSF